jgi:hypothetical protein
MYLYWKLVPAGRPRVTFQTGYDAEDKAIWGSLSIRHRKQREQPLTEAPGAQSPSCGILPTTKTFSPQTVLTVGAKVT